jgi:hypothetical protein
MGPATRWLKEQAATKLFRDATGESLDSKKMRDREFVNRFCAFQLNDVSTYSSGDMDDFLARTLEQMNEMDEEELTEISQAFQRSLRNNYMLFGRHAFRKHALNQNTRSILNASLWDVMSTGLARFPEEEVEQRSSVLKSRFYKLLEDSDFNDAITYGPNSVKKVKKRFELANRMFSEVFDA